MLPLRIGIDISPLRGLKTGVGFYLENLLQALASRPELEMMMFTGSDWLAGSAPGATAVEAGSGRSLAALARFTGVLGPAAAGAKALFNSTLVRPRYLARMPPGTRVMQHMELQLYGGAVPEILTVFDLSCIRHPETHPATRVAWHRRQLPRSLAAAAHILTISDFSKREIMECYGVPEHRITVTHCGVHAGFRSRDAAATTATLAPLGLQPGGYVLTTGTVEPRKNLGTLIRAHGMLPPDLQRRFPLVIAGKQGWKTGATMRIASGQVSAGTVRLLGYVDAAILPSLYSGALAFAYPSIYEGFGLPPLEAMASATPTAVSRSSSLPEVVGDAALLVEPADVDAWRHCLAELMEDPALRARLASAGPERARRFTWDHAANIASNVYRNLAGGRGT